MALFAGRLWLGLIACREVHRVQGVLGRLNLHLSDGHSSGGLDGQSLVVRCAMGQLTVGCQDADAFGVQLAFINNELARLSGQGVHLVLRLSVEVETLLQLVEVDGVLGHHGVGADRVPRRHDSRLPKWRLGQIIWVLKCPVDRLAVVDGLCGLRVVHYDDLASHPDTICLFVLIADRVLKVVCVVGGDGGGGPILS